MIRVHCYVLFFRKYCLPYVYNFVVYYMIYARPRFLHGTRRGNCQEVGRSPHLLFHYRGFTNTHISGDGAASVALPIQSMAVIFWQIALPLFLFLSSITSIIHMIHVQFYHVVTFFLSADVNA